MAIKLPDPGNGIPEQKTGNDEWTNMQIVRENFADQSNAASRLVGLSKGNLVAFEDIPRASLTPEAKADVNLNELTTSEYGQLYFIDAFNKSNEGINLPAVNNTTNRLWVVKYFRNGSASRWQTAYNLNTGEMWSRTLMVGGSPSQWGKFYSSRNTTKEEGTGYLVASSPVLKVQHDSFEKVHEAEQLDIEVKSIKTGVYEITGTTGLREDDGWNLKPPKDVNGNVLCICEATESNGVITLKTYKKKFDFETVSIVADYEQPTDIPEDATVMLRFNDLSEEQLDESAI